jgi:hypothetical protein
MPTYTVESTGDIALSAATAKTVLQAINSANGILYIVEIGASFDGISATAEPVTVELTSCTQATAGTNTAHTIVQVSGATRTVQATAARAYTAEPTVVTVLKRWLVHPQTGLIVQFPLGREPQQNTGSDALGIRCTAPATVNFQGYIEFGEG